MTNKIAIAIDGPSGAGKSTIAKFLASKFGFVYVDTGALYRTVALAVKQKNIATDDVVSIKDLLFEINIELKFIDGEQAVFLNSQNVSKEIRENEISKLASDVSAHTFVREYLFSVQKNISLENDIIMDGRDIGTVILPNANVKIYLTATADDRARRRYNQLLENGQVVEFKTLLEEIVNRDFNDMNRSVSPLTQADDAILVDTTGNTLEESIELLYNIIKNKLNGK